MGVPFRILSLFCSVFLCYTSHAQEMRNFTLKQALETAKSNNPDLKANRLEVEYAQTEIISAKTRPNISFATEIVQITNPSDYEDPSGRYRGANREELWELSKLIQTPAQRKHKIELATRTLEYESEHYFELENEVLTEVALKWLETQSAKKQLEAYKQAKQDITQFFPASSEDTENPNREFLRTEFIKTQFNLQYRTAELEVKNHLNELKLLLNIDYPIEIDIDDDILRSIPENLPELVQLAIENRNDMRAARLLSDVSESNVLLQKAMAIPQPEFGLLYNPKNNVTHVGFSATLDLPFFDRNQAERQRAEIQRNHAEQEVSALKLKIENETAAAMEMYLLHKQNLEDVLILKQHADVFLANSKKELQNEETDVFEFLEEYQEWLEIQLHYIEIQEDFQENYINLMAKTGMLSQLLD